MFIAVLGRIRHTPCKITFTEWDAFSGTYWNLSSFFIFSSSFFTKIYHTEAKFKRKTAIYDFIYFFSLASCNHICPFYNMDRAFPKRTSRLSKYCYCMLGIFLFELAYCITTKIATVRSHSEMNESVICVIFYWFRLINFQSWTAEYWMWRNGSKFFTWSMNMNPYSMVKFSAME